MRKGHKVPKLGTRRGGFMSGFARLGTGSGSYRRKKHRKRKGWFS